MRRWHPNWLTVTAAAIGLIGLSEVLSWAQYQVIHRLSAPPRISPSIRHAGIRGTGPKTRLLPSESRYLRSQSGLLPSQHRYMRMNDGALRSDGSASHLVYPSMRYGALGATRTAGRPAGTIRYGYSRSLSTGPGSSPGSFGSMRTSSLTGRSSPSSRSGFRSRGSVRYGFK